MSNPFSYDSKFMQALSTLVDHILLNLLYLLCCLPVVTIGAAQAGLYTAQRALHGDTDDRTPTAAFFRGFCTGFLKVTAAWCMLAIPAALCAYGILTAQSSAAQLICLVLLCLLSLPLTQLPLAHARFDCTPAQLLRNSVYLTGRYPLQTIAACALLCAPLLLLLWPNVLFRTAPLLALFYSSLAYALIRRFMRRPFEAQIAQFNQDP